MSKFRLNNRKTTGFSLPELLVVIVIIGIIGSVGVPAFFFLVRRERVNSVALEFVGWIENVRNAAADEVTLNDQGCEIVFSNNLTNLAPGALVATADCNVPENELRIPATIQESVNITFPQEDPPIIFTPRGVWIVNGEDGEPPELAEEDMLIQIDLGGNRPVRCVRLSRVLGSVDIGRPLTFLGEECDEEFRVL